MRRHEGRRRFALLVIMIALTLSACGWGGPAPTATPPPAPTTVAQAAATAADGPAVSPTAPAATPAPRPPTTTPAATTLTASAAVASATITTDVATTPAPATALPTAPPAAARPAAAAATPAPAPAVASHGAAGLPERLRIPRLRIDTTVEQVGQTADGAMDVPKRYDTVGWYKLGSRPGEQGSAVLAGHLDSKTGPAIFWYLRDLRPGDDIFVKDAGGAELRFVVQAAETYPYDGAPLDRIFAANDRVRLNLITCSGTFDRGSQNYNQRLVVYTTLAS